MSVRKNVPKIKGNAINETHMMKGESDSDLDPIIVMTTKIDEIRSIYD